jgi:uncharacterized protein (DUF362 family)
MELSRRKFVKTSLAAGGTAFMPAFIRAQPQAEPSEVVYVQRKGVLSGNTVNAGVVRQMVDTGIKILTGQTDLPAAWLSLFPGLNASSKILIKPSCLLRNFCTRFETIQAVCESLMALDLGGGARLGRNNISVYESTLNGQAGLNLAYQSDMSALDVTYTSAESAGFNIPVSVNGRTHYLTSLANWADYVINISVMKAHGDITGITGVIKSHMGSVSNNTGGYSIFAYTHQRAADETLCLNPIMGEILSGGSSAFIQKSVLNITDGIFGSYRGGTWDGVPNAWQTLGGASPSLLLFSKDMVALDTAHLDLTNQERTARSYRAYSLSRDTVNFPDASHILSAQAAGAGTTEYTLTVNDDTTDTARQMLDAGAGSGLAATPNPSNRSVKIRLYIPNPAKVSLDIFDIKGTRIVRLLDARTMPRGAHQVFWNGQKENNRPAASGTYFAHLKMENARYIARINLFR